MVAMDSRKSVPLVVPGERYNKYHVGKLTKSSENQSWNGLLYTRYLHPNVSDGCSRPATTDHILAMGITGGVKGHYAFNKGAWKPYIWRAKEWMLGSAFENERDSRERSLCSDEVELHACYLHLSPNIMEKVALEAADRSHTKIKLIHKMGLRDPFLLQMGLEIEAEVARENVYGSIFAETAAVLLSAYLLRKYCENPYKIPEYNGRKNIRKIRPIVEYIDSNIGVDLSLESMAKMANMSIYHFSRIFKEVLGVSPHRYIMDARIDRAKEMLKDRDKSISIIANNLGYSNSHFTQILKRYTGKTPYQYRREC